MTDIAGVLNVREHFPCVAEVIQIAPNQLPHKRRGKDCLRVVPVMRHDCLQLVTITAPAITGFLDSTERAVPNNDAVARMACCHQAVHDRVHHIMMRGEKFAPCRRDLNSNPVVGRHERRPRLRHVRLAGCGENEPIHHLTHNARVRLVIFDRDRIMHHIHD